MSEAEALYIPDGDAFVGTACTKGAWAHGGQAGGAVLALLGHVLEDVPTLTPMSLTRLTIDIVRPVPVGERLNVTTDVIREGKKIQVVDLTLTAGDTVTTRARALRIRDSDVGSLAGSLLVPVTFKEPGARPESASVAATVATVTSFWLGGQSVR